MSNTTEEMAVLRIVQNGNESTYECIDQTARTALAGITNNSKQLVFGDTLAVTQSASTYTINTKLSRFIGTVSTGVANVGNGKVTYIAIPTTSEATTLTVNCNINPGECANFACEIQNNSSVEVTVTVTLNSIAGSAGRASATDGKIASGKFCQVTCVGNCWTMAEFDPIEALVIGNRIYPTVKIGNQTWMAENLDYKFPGLTLGYSETDPAARYYNDSETTYGETGNKYGLLYNLVAMTYLEANKSTLIPGWHVPSASEWDTLVAAVGTDAGTHMKSTTGWNGSGNGDNTSGFNAYPTGRYNNIDTPHFGYLGSQSYVWTSTPASITGSYNIVEFTTGPIVAKSTGNANGEYCIRLIKDSV